MLDDFGDQRFADTRQRHLDRATAALVGALAQMPEYKQEIEAYRAAKNARPPGSPRIAVYTVISNAYDPLKPPITLDPRFDYIVFSDGPITDIGVYDIRPVPYLDAEAVRSARYVKTHPHVLLPDYDIAIWIDANILITGDISGIVDDFVASGKAVGAIPHPLRDSLFDEAAAVLERGKDVANRVHEQVAAYRKRGLAPKGLIESNLMLFQLGDRKTVDLLTAWWREINQFSRRDQLSLMVALDEHRIDWHPIFDRPLSLRTHPAFVLFPHRTNLRLQQRLLDRLTLGVVDPYEAPRYADVKRDRLAALSEVPIDVVVCVHNALADVTSCLASIERHRGQQQRLILVDDGSDAPTRDYLSSFTAERDWVTLHRNETAGGYTRAANTGLSLSSGELVILLNSDTVVTADWAEKMHEAVTAYPNGGIVGPLSSAASRQSIPDHRGTDTQTAVNGLPPGVSIDEMNDYCEQWFDRSVFPLVPLVHGFCMGITRAVIDTVGGMDEANFPFGYGEENDYCFRTFDAGFSLVVAPTTYVFHTKSKSYADERRIALSQAGTDRLKTLYGSSRVWRSIKSMQQNPILERMRAAAKELYPSSEPGSPGMEPRTSHDRVAAGSSAASSS